jgi:YtkA-like
MRAGCSIPTHEEKTMMWRSITATALLAASFGLNSEAFAGAADFRFEPVTAEMRKGDDVTIAVRLVNKATGKPVPDAVIIRTRIDMGPEGMGEMAAPVKPLPSPQPGVYAFKTDLTMAGRWQFTLAAKVQGEPDTITGKVIVRATK